MKTTTTTKNLKYYITLLVCIFFTSSGSNAKLYKNIEEVISKGSKSSHLSPVPTPVTQQPQKNVKFKKDKKGNFIVSWRTLSEYNATKSKIGKNLKKILDKNISIKGFMIPLDYSSKNIKEFLLVAYMPSCAHVPPPPPNMIINVKVKGKKKIKPSYFPVEINGKLKIVKSKRKVNPFMPEGNYSMITSSVKEIKR